MSVSVFSDEVDLKLMPHGWSPAKWDNSVIFPDIKPPFQIDLFCIKSIFPRQLEASASGQSGEISSGVALSRVS